MARTAVSAPVPGRGPRGPGRLVQVPEFTQWLDRQDRETRTAVLAHVRRVHRDPASHSRPLVDTITGSRMHNLKEIRIRKTVRVLFARDPHRNTVMLFGGDKAGQAKRFYREAVPKAEQRYTRHLSSIGKEPPWPHRNPLNRRPPGREH